MDLADTWAGGGYGLAVSGKTAFLSDPMALFADVAHRVRDRILHGGCSARRVVEARAEGYRQWDPHVLAADRIAEELILERLRAEGSRVTVISEEAGVVVLPSPGAPPDGSDGYYLVMDPLDGSILYERDIPAFWTVAMGLWKGSRHVATLVMDLASGKAWHAESGLVSERDSSGRHRRLGGAPDGLEYRTASATRLSDAYVATYLMKPHYLRPVVQRFHNVFLASRFVVPIGGPLAWAYVASGRIDAYVPLNQPLTEVYSAMGVAREAGCIITDLEGNEPRLVPDIHQRYSLVCARDPNLHAEILERIHQGGEDAEAM